MIIKFKHFVQNIVREITFYIFYLFCNVNDKKVLFDNFNGNGFGDNPKYIAEKLFETDYKLIWLVSDMNIDLPERIEKVKYGSLRHMYELATAKIWVDNVKNSYRYSKKKQQFYIQTWHAGLGVKKIERAVEKSLRKRYIKASKRDSKLINVFLSDCAFFEKKVIPDFWYTGPILRSGFPRNDILFSSSDDIKKKVFDYLEVEHDCKIILYAPTFREKASNFDMYKINFKEIIDCAQKKFGGNYIVLIRFHPTVKNKVIYEFNNKQIFNVTKYPDMQELLLITDILISDYSSCMFDFMLKKGKCFIIAKDYSDYLAKERSFYFNLEELPFPFANSEIKLMGNINNFDEKIFHERCTRFLQNVGMYENSSASEKVANLIKEKVNQ